MSSPVPPTIGQTDWGQPLNDYVLSLEARIRDLETQTADLEQRVQALEAAP